jgi:hypothetical protein
MMETNLKEKEKWDGKPRRVMYVRRPGHERKVLTDC